MGADTTKAKPVRLLSGGNPQIAKADGDALVQESIKHRQKRNLATFEIARLQKHRGIPESGLFEIISPRQTRCI